VFDLVTRVASEPVDVGELAQQLRAIIEVHHDHVLSRSFQDSRTPDGSPASGPPQLRRAPV